MLYCTGTDWPLLSADEVLQFAVSPLTLFSDDIDSVHFRYCDKAKCRWLERVLVGVWPVSGWLRVAGPAGRGMCGEERRLLSVGRTLAMPTAGASWIQVSHHLPNVPNDLGQLWQWHRVYESPVSKSEWLMSMTSNPLLECGHTNLLRSYCQYSVQCLSLDSCLSQGGPAGNGALRPAQPGPQLAPSERKILNPHKKWPGRLLYAPRALTPLTRVLPYLHQFSFFAVTWLLWSEIQFKIRRKLSVWHITFPILNPIDFRRDFMILAGLYLHMLIRYHLVL